jgi:N-acetylmuramoyl-L-alanine amidase
MAALFLAVNLNWNLRLGVTFLESVLDFVIWLALFPTPFPHPGARSPDISPRMTVLPAILSAASALFPGISRRVSEGLMAVLGMAVLNTLCHAGTVIVDAGHGGHDPGGITGQRYVEKVAALDVALRLSARLRTAGHRVILTRGSDTFIELSRRVSISNSSPSKAVFVSVHFNASPNTDAAGIETYYCSPQSEGLAQAVHASVMTVARSEDRGVRKARFFVLRYNRRPAVLVELGFLTNAKEGAQIFKSSKYRQSLANAVAAGLRNHLR